MTAKPKTSAKDKERKLVDKIEQAKKDLTKLQEKRKKEIGALAYKYGLEHFDNKTLGKAFANLATELSNGNN